VAIALLLNPSSKQTEPHSLGALNVENRVNQYFSESSGIRNTHILAMTSIF
jgi:hypothetical protein